MPALNVGTGKLPTNHDASWLTGLSLSPKACDIIELLGDEELEYSCMPTAPYTPKHRNRNPKYQMPFSACVARPVGKKELNSTPKALKAILEEWEKLRKAGTWDETKVREWDDVAAEARRTNKKAHVGRIFEICVEKGSELKENDPGRKFKGRVVFQGNDVKDESWETAIFQELSSAPASMQAGKATDAFGLQPGFEIEQADAEQAYIQSKLAGDPTWIRIPRERQPDAWKKMRDPVCPLILALYGHPDSGGYWEKHCDDHLRTCGFVPVNGWRSTYFHKGLKAMLTVYVNDFKLAAPKENLSKVWGLMRTKIKMENPKPLSKYLGCDHIVQTINAPEGCNPFTKEVIKPLDIGNSKGIITKKQKAEATAKEGSSSNATPTKAHGPNMSYKCITYDMSDFVGQCVDRYCELAKVDRKKLRDVPTPFVDEGSFADKDDQSEGALKPIASKVLMKILYAARMARYDVLRAVCSLASLVTKWTKNCDKQLHRLVCYLNSSVDMKLVGWVGETIEKWHLELFADADLASDLLTRRSTSGVYLCLAGPNTRMPQSAVSKKQSCVSHSTPEAELVAADVAIRTEGFPALELWKPINQGKDLPLNFREDNQSAIQVIKNGKNPTEAY